MFMKIVLSRISKTENVFQKRTGVIWRANRKEYDFGVQVNRSGEGYVISLVENFATCTTIFHSLTFH